MKDRPELAAYVHSAVAEANRLKEGIVTLLKLRNETFNVSRDNLADHYNSLHQCSILASQLFEENQMLLDAARQFLEGPETS